MLASFTKIRTNSSRSFLPLILCVAVFAWGMQYKLSLYSQPSSSHPKSVAKLFTDNQVSKKSILPHSSDRDFGPKIAFWAALVLFVLAAVVVPHRQASKVFVSSISSRSYALFFRPPPSQA